MDYEFYPFFWLMQKTVNTLPVFCNLENCSYCLYRCLADWRFNEIL